MKTVLALLILALICGCRTTDGPNYVFPSWAKSTCYEELYHSRDVIDKVGVHNVKPHSVMVRFVDGEKKFGNNWAGSRSVIGFNSNVNSIKSINSNNTHYDIIQFGE